jgi:Cytochrome domain of cellobiose dehydrogenase
MVLYRVWVSNGWLLNACGLALGQRCYCVRSSCFVFSASAAITDIRGQGLPPVYSGPILQVVSSVVTNSSTTAHLRCSNCTEWSGGNLDINSTSADFIYAYGEIPPENPANPDSDFFIHIDTGNFNLNLQDAQSLTNTTLPSTLPGTASTGFSTRQKVDLWMYVALSTRSLSFTAFSWAWPGEFYFPSELL